MQVSFSGIKNLYIGKRQNSKFGSYVNSDGEIRQNEKSYTQVKIRCELTDDESGDNLSAFKNALVKSSERCQLNCIDKDNPSRLEILLTRQDIDDQSGLVSHSNIKLNGYDISLNEKGLLPMYTYLAHFSKEIADLPNASDAQKYYANLLNKSVDEEARNYIDLF